MIEDEIFICEAFKCPHGSIGRGEYCDIVVKVGIVKTLLGFQQVGELKQYNLIIRIIKKLLIGI